MKNYFYHLTVLLCIGCQPSAPAPLDTDFPPKAIPIESVENTTVNQELENQAKRLSSSNVEERRAAAYALGQAYDRNAVPHLLAALDDSDLYVRIYIIQSLRDLRDDRAVNRLCEILTKQTAEPLIVSNVMRALGAIRSPLAIPTLSNALQSDDPFTRYDAAFALGEMGDPSVIPALEKLLSDTTKPERRGEDGMLNSTMYTVGEQARRAIDMLQSN